MTRKQRRLVLIGGSGAVLAVAVGLVLNAMSGSIVFFQSPTEVAEKHIAPGTRIRIGGLVKPGSVERGADLRVKFEVTDGNKDFRYGIRASCRICFAKGRVSSPKASSSPADT